MDRGGAGHRDPPMQPRKVTGPAMKASPDAAVFGLLPVPSVPADAYRRPSNAMSAPQHELHDITERVVTKDELARIHAELAKVQRRAAS